LVKSIKRGLIVKIACPQCKKEYNIPDERLSDYKEDFVLPCSSCKNPIEIKIQSVPSEKGYESGEKLKERIFRTLGDLPPMPQVAQKARQMLSDTSSSISNLAKIIETDLAITTRVLKLANSAYYGVSGMVSSVQHASVVVGTQTLMELLNLACSSTVLSQTLKGYDLEAGDLWKHSLAVASGSQIIAKKKKPELEQNAFSAGLIHDVGKLILDPYIFERKEAFQDFLKDEDESFLSAEKKILGFDHSEIASEVCEKWQIPQELAHAIRYHHNPSESQEDDLSYIVHAADAVAMMSGIGSGMDGLLYNLDEKAIELLKLDDADMNEIMGQVAEYVEKTSEE